MTHEEKLKRNRAYMAEYRKRPGMKERHAAYHKTWVEKHPERAQEIARKKQLSLYGITTEQYQALLTAQDGKCAICRSPNPGGKGKSFHVDHDHKTGTVRGLLCNNCNRGIGHLKDSEQIAYMAWRYLFRWLKPCD